VSDLHPFSLAEYHKSLFADNPQGESTEERAESSLARAVVTSQRELKGCWNYVMKPSETRSTSKEDTTATQENASMPAAGEPLAKGPPSASAAEEARSAYISSVHVQRDRDSVWAPGKLDFLEIWGGESESSKAVSRRGGKSKSLGIATGVDLSKKKDRDRIDAMIEA